MTLKISDEEVTEIRRRYEAGKVRQRDLAAEFGVSQGAISLIVSRRQHVAERKGPSLRGRVDASGRECSRCREYKLWTEYALNNRSTTGHASACRQCRSTRATELAQSPFVAVVGQHVPSGANSVRKFRTAEEDERERRSLYLQYTCGITLSQYEWLADQQGQKCALCMEPESVRRQDITGRGRDCLGVDHDHGCQQHPVRRMCVHCIRGLLCDGCNRLLGFAEGKAAVAVRFSDYLGQRPFLMGGG